MDKSNLVNVRRVIDDILAGLGDVVIMEKYNLSPAEYSETLQKVKNAKGLDSNELNKRIDALNCGDRKSQERRSPRNYMMFETQIRDRNDPTIAGSINDLNEKGVQIRGISAQVGELRDFFIVGSEVIFLEKPLQFQAQCKWTAQDKYSGEDLAGFEIKKMTPSTLRGIKKLINRLAVTERFGAK